MFPKPLLLRRLRPLNPLAPALHAGDLSPQPEPIPQVIEQLFDRFLPARRRARLERLRQAEAPRAIRIHSILPQPEDAPPQAPPRWYRVAFEFLDPPGPQSMQFYEASAGQTVLDKLAPGTEAHYYESRDQARARLIATSEGEPLWPR